MRDPFGVKAAQDDHLREIERSLFIGPDRRAMGEMLDAIEFEWPGVLVEHDGGGAAWQDPEPGTLVVVGPGHDLYEVLSARPRRLRLRRR